MKYIFSFVLLLFISPSVSGQYLSDCFKLSSEATDRLFELNTDKDTICGLDISNPITGFSVSGDVEFDNDRSGYVRILLIDGYNYEHLVFESYPLLSGVRTSSFQNTAIETIHMNPIVPVSIRIEIREASIQIHKIHVIFGDRQASSQEIYECKKSQNSYIANRLNENLVARNMTWKAGVTSVSEKTFEEKKSMFGGIVPELYGFDYYVDGVFVFPDYNPAGVRNSSQFVSEWDWRNRHGKNWMTPVRFQDNCGSCWAFSAVGIVEPYINLYYNKLLNYDLSEQELVSCASTNGCFAENISKALGYIKTNGVVLEDCFNYTGSVVDCSRKCSVPAEKVKIQGYQYYLGANICEDFLKEIIISSPIAVDLPKWDHYLVLAGFKTIQVNDVLYSGNSSNTGSFTVDSIFHSELIGKTAWLIKNSWGNNWGNGGYAYLVVNDSLVKFPKSIYGSISSMIFDDNDIVCEDADGDGYYYWGVGPKPTFCPNWIPDTPDGNDADQTEGALDSYGFIEHLNPDSLPALVIENDSVFSTRQNLYSNIRILQNATMSVESVLNMFGNSTITIENGGKLVINGGVVTNTYIDMKVGSELLLENDGMVVCRTNSVFHAPFGSILNVVSGKICTSHDF